MKQLLLIFFSLFNILPTPTSIAPVTKTCPEGYILVPGSIEFQTSDFCVMKYTAKCALQKPQCITYEGVYNNSLPGCECGSNIVSSAKGGPITYIPEIGDNNINAKAYCKNAYAHLITNSEWMSIARNIEQVSANWCDKDGTNCGQIPGTEGKILANGHNDSVPNKALEAGSDNMPCFGTGANGSNICGSSSSQKRTLKLSNGEVIWDFAGNVWQWVDFTIRRKDEAESLNPNKKYAKWIWEEFQSVPYDKTTMPSNPKWTGKQGVGRIFHYSYVGDIDLTLYTNIRGGNWRHGYDSGAFTSHFQPVPSKSGIDDVGFRCVTKPQ